MKLWWRRSVDCLALFFQQHSCDLKTHKLSVIYVELAMCHARYKTRSTNLYWVLKYSIYDFPYRVSAMRLDTQNTHTSPHTSTFNACINWSKKSCLNYIFTRHQEYVEGPRYVGKLVWIRQLRDSFSKTFGKKSSDEYE